ncbi:hypothetical protein NY78_3571 [Desulfovibrio sp. TomC]|nr:hypothetical protein NY78_3571 [Desulfovibrio sp. TomC]
MDHECGHAKPPADMSGRRRSPNDWVQWRDGHSFLSAMAQEISRKRGRTRGCVPSFSRRLGRELGGRRGGGLLNRGDLMKTRFCPAWSAP